VAVNAPLPRRVAPRPARLPAEERREHFLDVTAELIIREGIDAVTMEGVAAAAGVSKGLGYAYFANRNELLLALLERELQELDRRALAGARDADSMEHRIRAALTAWFETVRERGRLLGTLMQASQLQDALKERRSIWNRQFEDFWASLAERELGVPRDKAVAACAILLAGMNGVLERWVDCGDSRVLLEEVYVGLAIGGLRSLSDRA